MGMASIEAHQTVMSMASMTAHGMCITSHQTNMGMASMKAHQTGMDNVYGQHESTSNWHG